MFHTLKSAFKFSFRKKHPNLFDLFQEQWLIWSSAPRFINLKWEPIEDIPIERVEAAGVIAHDKLYVIGGYYTLDKVISRVDVWDLKTHRWGQGIDFPSHIAQTHQGIDCENSRYIYNITGQVGIQCSPCVSNCYVFDLETRQWNTLPPLPKGRYAPMTRLWKGRIHVVGGSQEDRVTPANEHWSLAVKDGKALEDHWREEPPIPLGGPHRASAVVGDELFVLGAQQGDRPPIPGDPRFTCDWKTKDEIFYRDCFALKQGSQNWRRLADIPVPASHTEFSTFVLNKSIVVIGGLTERKIMTDLIQVYETTTNTWKIIGRLPIRNKGCVALYYQGWLYVIAGQKQAGRLNPAFGQVIKSGWRARFSESL